VASRVEASQLGRDLKPKESDGSCSAELRNQNSLFLSGSVSRQGSQSLREMGPFRTDSGLARLPAGLAAVRHAATAARYPGAAVSWICLSHNAMWAMADLPSLAHFVQKARMVVDLARGGRCGKMEDTDADPQSISVELLE
jgi:hypothetical protein